jgi:hypothetical protein
MNALDWAAPILMLGVNAHAVVALVLGFRRRPSSDVGRLARRTALSVVVVVLAMAVDLVARVGRLATLAGGVPVADGASQKAMRLSMLISAILNTAALTAVACLLPIVVALILHYRRVWRADDR